MEMNRHTKTILLLALLLTVRGVQAEDVVQVKPFTTTAGITLDDEETFSMEMVNTNAYTALEFRLTLPEGITLDMEYPFEMNPDRFPGKTRKGIFYPNHDYDITNPAPGQYYIKIYNTALETIDGTEGEILTFYYETSADLKPGYYPIRVTGTILAIDSHNGVEPPASVSFVAVTNDGGEVPANALLDLGSDEIPSFVASELPEKNVVRGGVCENLVLTDGADFAIDGEITARTATLGRKFTAGRWNTVCLPFDMTAEDIASQLGTDAEVKEMTAVTRDGDNYKLTFGDATGIQAGLPYIIRVGSNVNSISLEEKTVVGACTESTIDDVTYRGTFAYGKAPLGSYIISGNAFYAVNSDVTLPAFRGYFTVDAGAEVKGMTLVIDGEDDATSINEELRVTKQGSTAEGKVNEESKGTVYDIAGQRMDNGPWTMDNSHLPKGIYVVGGKKVLK